MRRELVDLADLEVLKVLVDECERRSLKFEGSLEEVRSDDMEGSGKSCREEFGSIRC